MRIGGFYRRRLLLNLPLCPGLPSFERGLPLRDGFTSWLSAMPISSRPGLCGPCPSPRPSPRKRGEGEETQPCAPPSPCGLRRGTPALIRRFRNENLAAEHLLDGVEGIHELTQFDNAAFVEPDEIGDEKLNGAIGRALA
jgi:hypothetical protein